jgi:hypothetical protein
MADGKAILAWTRCFPRNRGVKLQEFNLYKISCLISDVPLQLLHYSKYSTTFIQEYCRDPNWYSYKRRNLEIELISLAKKKGTQERISYQSGILMYNILVYRVYYIRSSAILEFSNS